MNERQIEAESPFITILIFMLTLFIPPLKKTLSLILVITFSDSLLESCREFFLCLIENWYVMNKIFNFAFKQ